MKRVHQLCASLLIMSSLLVASATWANGGGSTFKEGVNYLPMKPPLIVNYGGTGKVRYIKAEISLRTEDAHSAAEVDHHMPLIRDTLIMLLSTMTLDQLSSGEGKEEMRLEALARVNEALEEAENPPEPEEKSVHKPKSKAGHGKDEQAAHDAPEEDHSEPAHGKEKPAKNDHAEEEPADDSHEKASHGKKGHGKEEKATASHKKSHDSESEHGEGLVSDLLFDNLVVQK
jgi:flagellar basal body-associated protein FliL